jgi:excinuclease ABC subunit A
MPASDIIVKGAREHNLQDVSLVLPRNKLICLTGVSGSGKSSLAFDTLYAEGQRRYVESLSSFARQFLGQMPKPDVDLISGLSPSISISQKSSGNNPRSTVGTITEIYDFLRVLYARVGQGFCPRCDNPISAQSRDQIIASILQHPSGTEFKILAPVVRAQKGEHRDLFQDLLKQGFARVRVDGEIKSLSGEINLDRKRRHDVEVLVDRLANKSNIRGRLAEAVELALKVGQGTLILAIDEDEGDKPEEAKAKKAKPTKRGQQRAGDRVYSADYACSTCGVSFRPPTPQMFSFNSPQGMCSECSGLGDVYTFDPELLIPDASLTFKQGAVELIGKWKEIGRWRRHIYQGVADTMERTLELEEGTLLETPWKDLKAKHQELWLYGTDEQHITYTWRGGNSPMKYGGKFDGIIPELDEKYRSLKSAPKQRQLENYMDQIACASCEGERLNNQARHFRLETASKKFESPSKSLPEVCNLSIEDASEFFAKMNMDDTRAFVANEPLKEIRNRLGFLLNVGLNYLNLDRTAPTLSGGESQRIRLAGQIGAGLVGVLYILDEPSIGLHSRDNDRLIDTLQSLRDLGNTVIVVEHDEETMRAADHIVDFGPGPGVHGGDVVVEGSPAEVMKAKKSVTGQFLSGNRKIEVPKQRRPVDTDNSLRIVGAAHNNLKDVTVEIPLNAFVCITGVSGSGKSSLVNDILVEELRERLNRGIGDPGYFEKIEGIELLDKLIAIDQTPIGRTPRSNPGTYIKLFDEIRSLYSKLPDSKKRGYKPGRFSFNVKGGRCEACEGNGSNKLEMDFLADVWVTCPVCQGERFNRETLQVRYKEKSIADVLNMSVENAIGFFESIPKIHDRLRRLQDVGLDYLKIGQPSPTLSGGEAQRIKLARELVKKSTGKTLYLLDEPTTGLHFADIDMLLKVLHAFVDVGNTVLVVEHNMDVIKTADWIIDLGPDGGVGGGEIVCAGTPEQVAACEESFTGRALAKAMGIKPTSSPKTKVKTSKKKKKPELATEIRVRGAEQHNLRSVDVNIKRDEMTVFCGPSGSGKSSLAMDTIYAEGQRRYVESLSSYARQFVNQLDKPRVEQIEGLSPAIAIEQKNLGSTPRSTVGTVTEIYDYLRILFARTGTPYCPDCDKEIGTQTSDQVVDKIMAYEEGQRLVILAPIELDSSQQYEQLWEEIRSLGYMRVRIDGQTFGIDEVPAITRRSRHDVEIVVDRIEVKSKSRSRIADSIESGLSLGKGLINIAVVESDRDEQDWPVVRHSQHLACDCCGRSFDRLSPHNFSFNSQLGWCEDCEGIGTQMGASPALMLRDNELSLAEGAVRLWPDVSNETSLRMLEALGTSAGVTTDIPFNELDARQRRIIFYGTGERWIDVKNDKDKTEFSFQFKGLYPTIDEACRLSPTLRHRMQALIAEVECGGCGGSRLRDDAAAMRFRDLTVDGICRMPLGRLQETLQTWKLDKRETKIAGELIREIKNRVEFLNDVGLEYISISRTSASLSNGEAQRIRLASQLGSGLCGVLYVLDEPTIGLHPRDNHKLLNALHRLRDLGNTLLVVEHDREVIENSDSICDFGPKAGAGGGTIVAHGTAAEIAKKRASVTGPYISGKKSIPIPSNRRIALAPPPKPKTTKKKATKKKATKKKKPEPPVVLANSLDIIGARHNNLKEIDVQIPLQTLTVVTGPSGCGKSSLINEVLYNSLARRLHRANLTPGAHTKIVGLDHINKVIRVDQQPLGNSPTSNPATYTGVFEQIRNLFSQLPDAKVRGYSARRFSFNVPGGRCEECVGNGQICIEMHFLPDVWVECQACKGKRYNPETLAVRYHGHSINDVLNMTCEDASKLFKNIPKISRTLQTLCDVGLDYVTLGQSAPTLSGGEAQRVKLAAELSRPDTGRTLYLLDEPTTGLHFDDLAKLLNVLQRLVDVGNTVLLIEHNLDIIKAADWVIDLGPEAGQGGGQIVVQGTPETVVEYAISAKSRRNKKLRSWTGEALEPVMQESHYAERKIYDPATAFKSKGIEIEEVGKDVKMPWEADGRRWHTQERVDRKGQPVHWDGTILEKVVEFIEKEEGFSETNWNARTVVEIAASKASQGWFFHAITGETWLLKMKFRVRRGTFKRDDLLKQIHLKTPNEMDEIPVYGNQSRVKVVNNKGAWQEVEIRAHDLEEIDTPQFWEFLDDAIGGFQNRVKRVEMKLDDHTPWAKLGQKWHFLRKGFPTGKKVAWDVEVLEVLHDTLTKAAPNSQFLWSNKQVVHLYVEEQKEPWASIQTKKSDGVWLQLNVPKDSVPLGRIADLAEEPIVKSGEKKDLVRMKFSSSDLAGSDELKSFLEEHLSTLSV